MILPIFVLTSPRFWNDVTDFCSIVYSSLPPVANFCHIFTRFFHEVAIFFVLMLPVFAHPLAVGPGRRRPEEAGELYPQSPPGPEFSQGIKNM